MVFRRIPIVCFLCASLLAAADSTLRLRAIVQADPANVDARLMLGSALALEGKRSESIEETVRAVRLAPNRPAVHNALGTILSRFGEFDLARQAFEEALRLDPQFAEAHVNLALVLATQGDTDAAAAHLDRAIAILGSSREAATAYCLRGKIFSEQDDFETAASRLEQAVRLRPDYADAWSELGAVRAILLDDAGALTALERSVRLDQRNALAQYRLGSQYLRDERAGEATVYLKEALRLGYDRRAALYKLQRALHLAGRNEESRLAEAELKQLAPAPDDAIKAESLNNEGVASEKTGDLRKAIEKYRQAVELDPGHNGFRLNYGLALCRLDRWREGIAELREVTLRDPDNAKATRALYIATDNAARAQAAPPQQ